MSTKGFGNEGGLGDYVELDLEGGKHVTGPKHVHFSSSIGRHDVVIGVNLPRNWMVPNDFALQDTECKYFESVEWRAGDGKSKDKNFLPIIEINASSAADVDEIVSSMAAEDIIIPKVSIIPTKISCRVVRNGKSHPNGKGTFDLALQFHLKKTTENPEEWVNWSLQFLHNHLYDSFATNGAQEMKDSFQITLARGIVWKSDQHMKDFLAQSERILHSWNHKGSAAISEEIYLRQNGVATNCFKNNMTTPYNSKVNRCLISNVIDKVSINASAPAVAWFMANAVASGVKAITSVVSPFACSTSTQPQFDESSSIMGSVTSGVKTINSAVSPMASSVSSRLQSEDLLVAFAEDREDRKLKQFNYALYLRVKSKKVNIKGIAQEQKMDLHLKKELKLHPKMFCTKEVGDYEIILAKGRDGKDRIIVPKSLQEDILKLHHNCLVNPTAANNFDTEVYDTFTWNGIHKDVKQYVEKARQEKALQEKWEAQQKANIQIGGNISQGYPSDAVDVIPVINDEVKKKWWKPLLPKKSQRHNKNTSTTFDAPPSLVKLSDYSVSTTSGLSSSNGKQQPSVTEELNDDNYRLIAELPGVKPDNLKVDFFKGGSVLKVSGTQQINQGNFTETNQFEKCFNVSARDLNTAAAVARLSNGVLIVTAPKTWRN